MPILKFIHSKLCFVLDSGTGMVCPFCHSKETRVVDKRDNEEVSITRRRRECLSCENRFTTYERVEKLAIKVRKKDGSSQDYDREKLINGVVVCAEKRLSREDIEKIVDDLEAKLTSRKASEISSVELGKMVLDQLKDRDKIAYLRFASVFLDFDSVDELKDEINKIENGG